MCGRYALFMQTMPVDPVFGRIFGELQVSRYNIAPEQAIPVWTAQGLDFIHWGMTRTVYNNAIKEAKQINTRLETMLTAPHQYSARRCAPVIVLASGFFEWKTVAMQKIPYFIQPRSQTLIGLAALAWKDPVRKIWEGLTIITQETAGPLGSIYHRKPILLTQPHWDEWLHSTPKKWMNTVAQEIPESELMAYAVSKQVNDPTFNHTLAVRPLNG